MVSRPYSSLVAEDGSLDGTVGRGFARDRGCRETDSESRYPENVTELKRLKAKARTGFTKARRSLLVLIKRDNS